MESVMVPSTKVLKRSRSQGSNMYREVSTLYRKYNADMKPRLAIFGGEGRGACRSEASSGRHRVCGVASARAAIKTQVRQVPCTGARVHAARRSRAAGTGRGRG